MRELGNMWLAYNQKIEIFKSKNKLSSVIS